MPHAALFFLFLLIHANINVVLATNYTTPSQSSAFPDIWCAAAEWRGLTFARTRACQTVTLDCPNPEEVEGTVSWTCDCNKGIWIGETPDSTACTHRWVRELREGIQRGELVDTLSQVLNTQLGRTVNSRLYGGDISGSVGASADMLSLARSQLGSLSDRVEATTRSTNFTQNFGGAGDHLLSAKAQPTWAELIPSSKVELAAQLMALLQESSLLWAEYINSAEQQLQYSQWAVNVKVARPLAKVANRVSTMTIPGNMEDAPAFSPTASSSNLYSTVKQNISFSFAASPLISLPSVSSLHDSVVGSSLSSQQTAMFHPAMRAGASIAAAPVDSDSADAAVPSLDRTPIKMAYFIFTALGDLLLETSSQIINSQVIGAAVNDAERSIELKENVTFTFPHLKTKGVANARCVYWSLTLNEWSEDGCSIVTTDNAKTVCTCNHLTSFAILMDVSGNVGQLSGGLANALDIVSSIGCAFSIVCLTLSLFVFTCFRSLYKLRTTIHRNLCLCLLIGNLVFVIGIDRTSNETGCSIVALLLHYFFLAAFFWMLIEGYQLYMMLIQVFEPSNKRIILLVALAYGTPAIIVAISSGIKWKDYGTESYCWINTATPTIWAFIAPVIIVVVANIGFLLIALKVVFAVNATDKTRAQRVLGWLKGSATLLCLLGVTWIFGFLTAVKGTTMAFAWIFTIFNCTQGVFIFVLHVLMNDKVRFIAVRWLRNGTGSSAEYNSKEYATSRQRMLNILRGHSTPETTSTADNTKGATQVNSSTPVADVKANGLLHQLSTPEKAHEKGLAYRASDQSPQRLADLPSSSSSSSNDSSDPRVSLELDLELNETRQPVQRRKFPLGARASERGSKGQTGRRRPEFTPSASREDVSPTDPAVYRF